MDYADIWKRVETLPWCTLVTTGRTGSDLFQSLLDSHPELFVFNGKLFFHTFWESAHSVVPDREPVLSDLLDEFIETHMAAFKSKYDPDERKDQLGDNRDQSIDISTDEIKTHVTGLLDGKPVTSRNVFTAIYVAYELCLKRDISAKKLFFHHIHHVRKIDAYMADFPDSKIICMTRDPRALYVSGVENWRRHQATADNPSYPLYILWRAVDEIAPLEKYDDGRLRVLKLEDLAEEQTLHAVCEWLGISFNACMKESTWAGMRWWGDEVSQNQIPENERGFSKTMTRNKWEQKLDAFDKFRLNYLLVDVLEWYGYPCYRHDGIFIAALMALAILVPMRYERRYLAPRYLGRALAEINPRKFIASFYHPFRRVIHFYKWFYRRNFGSFFTAPYLRQSEE